MNNTNTTKKAKHPRALLGSPWQITRWGDGLTVDLSHWKMVSAVDVFHTTWTYVGQDRNWFQNQLSVAGACRLPPRFHFSSAGGAEMKLCWK
jgi:hypothetical protein